MTVHPAKSTARPDVARARPLRRLAPSLVEPLSVSGDDEQGVVDSHSEADHGQHLGGEGRARSAGG